jgi:hypothetical protein
MSGGRVQRVFQWPPTGTSKQISDTLKARIVRMLGLPDLSMTLLGDGKARRVCTPEQ